jgi:hypothetical protein
MIGVDRRSVTLRDIAALRRIVQPPHEDPQNRSAPIGARTLRTGPD